MFIDSREREREGEREEKKHQGERYTDRLPTVSAATED